MPPPARLLVVEDEPSIRELLAGSLRHEGYQVLTAGAGAEGIRAVAEHQPDLVILDVMLPDMDGFEVLRRLRTAQTGPAVLLLTARGATDDLVTGLGLGGDDYVTKPFSLDELLARIRAVLRRAGIGSRRRTRLAVRDLELDEDSHEVRRAGRPIALSPTEFRLLRYLMLNAGRVVSKAQICDRVWQTDLIGDGNVVELYVSYLRKKIGPSMIQTVRGVGYRLS